MNHREALVLPRWERMPAANGFGPGIALDVGGVPLWWASDDVELRPSPAAALCLLAPWCALDGRPLRVPELDPGLLRNVQAATSLMGGWWGHGPLALVVEPGPAAPQSPGAADDRQALFFSGGIDSFYSLTREPDIGTLVFIAGFDVRLANRPVWTAMARSWRALADELQLRFVMVATNLRDHPLLGRMRWARYHGAVLAGAAHLLAGESSRWLVSASYHVSNLMPWGSHPGLDPLWSGAGIGIRHYGAEVWRAEKLAAMAGVPYVHRHLRVCYDAPRAEGNCGRCEKCVRTRLVYWQDLPGVTCSSMPAEPGLVEALDALPPLAMNSLVRIYQRFLERAPGGDPVTSALAALIMRSGTEGRR